MQLRTYTGLWKVEKRLYKFYDINLPYPVSVKQIGILMVTAVPWLGLMGILGVPFAPPFGHLIWLAPPVIITWFANRPIAEGKTAFEYAWSQLGYVLRPRVWADLRPADRKPRRFTVRVRPWRRFRVA